jgi:tRNA (cmo5U34)-methyltransferase
MKGGGVSPPELRAGFSYLAQHFPQWRFTVVEPAAPMLDIRRRRVEECGIASRCTLPEGYLDSLPGSYSFNAATCFTAGYRTRVPHECRFFFSS